MFSVDFISVRFNCVVQLVAERPEFLPGRRELIFAVRAVFVESRRIVPKPRRGVECGKRINFSVAVRLSRIVFQKPRNELVSQRRFLSVDLFVEQRGQIRQLFAADEAFRQIHARHSEVQKQYVDFRSRIQSIPYVSRYVIRTALDDVEFKIFESLFFEVVFIDVCLLEFLVQPLDIGFAAAARKIGDGKLILVIIAARRKSYRASQHHNRTD